MKTQSLPAPVHQPGPIERASIARRAAEAATSAPDTTSAAHATSARIAAARTELNRLLALHRQLAGDQADDVLTDDPLAADRLRRPLTRAAALIVGKRQPPACNDRSLVS